MQRPVLDSAADRRASHRHAALQGMLQVPRRSHCGKRRAEFCGDPVGGDGEKLHGEGSI